jgi:hypothetical protein
VTALKEKAILMIHILRHSTNSVYSPLQSDTIRSILLNALLFLPLLHTEEPAVEVSNTQGKKVFTVRKTVNSTRIENGISKNNRALRTWRREKRLGYSWWLGWTRRVKRWGGVVGVAWRSV